MVRGDLLDSDRYWGVGIEARQLFFHLILLADDLGCVPVGATFLRRRAFNDSPADQKISKLLSELADVDLIRLYDHERACYAFIPRFRQRLQRVTPKHPQPPQTLLEGDADAKEKFNEINENLRNPSARSRVSDKHSAARSPLSNHRREEKRREEIQGSAFQPPAMVEKVWPDFEEHRKKLRKPMTDKARVLIVKKLESLQNQGHDPIAVLEQSIRQGWQDVFPLRADSKVTVDGKPRLAI